MIAAVDAAETEEAEPIAGLCGQRLVPARSQDLLFTDAMEEVCFI